MPRAKKRINPIEKQAIKSDDTFYVFLFTQAFWLMVNLKRPDCFVSQFFVFYLYSKKFFLLLKRIRCPQNMTLHLKASLSNNGKKDVCNYKTKVNFPYHTNLRYCAAKLYTVKTFEQIGSNCGVIIFYNRFVFPIFSDLKRKG